jgi:multiple sugar transport system substrate-binding protein
MKVNSLCFVLIIVFSIVLSGCGNKTTTDDGRTIVEFMHSSVEQERLAVINKLVAKFEKENPDIKIKQVPVEEGNYNTKVVTLARSGNLPAVIEVGNDYAKVMEKDELIDRKSVNKVLDHVGKENFYEGAIDLLGTEDGKSYTGVPVSGWVQGIWYNKEMLKAKGMKEPKDWNEIMEVAKAFTDKSSKKYGIAIPTVEGPFSEQGFSQIALSNNANVFNANGDLKMNTPEMKEALTYYKKLSQYTMPGSNDTTEIKDAFMNGTVPMAMFSTYILPSVFEEGDAQNIGYIVPEQEQKAVYGMVSALTISSGLEANQKKASEKFVSFMSEPENTTEWVLMSPGGAQPVNKQVTDNPDYQSNEVVKAFGSLSTEIAASFNDIQAFGLVDGKNYLKMGDVTSSGAIPTMINNITVGKSEIKSELKKAEKTIKDALDKR